MRFVLVSRTLDCAVVTAETWSKRFDFTSLRLVPFPLTPIDSPSILLSTAFGYAEHLHVDVWNSWISR